MLCYKCVFSEHNQKSYLHQALSFYIPFMTRYVILEVFFKVNLLASTEETKPNMKVDIQC